MQTQVQAQSPSTSSPPSIESYILDHERRIQTLSANSAEIINHLNQLGQLRQQQKAEFDRTISSLKTEVTSMRSYIWLCIVGMVGTALLAATSSIFQTQQINQLQERAFSYVQPRQGIQTRKN